jgi:cytochrome P450
MNVAPPPAYALDNPLRKVASDLWDQVRAVRDGGLPPGPTGVDPRRDLQWMRYAPSVLLPAYDRYGPIFSVRLLHTVSVFMLGPEAQHFLLVSDADKFHWREGAYRELIPFLGDGLITTDEEYHDRCRRLMLPVFHTEHLAHATRVMLDEVDRALELLVPGQQLEVYPWVRQVGMRVAMRALFGFDPDAMDAAETAAEFERGLSFYGKDLALFLLRGPGTPYTRMRAARAKLAALIRAEITRRRATPTDGEDILSLLIRAEDEDGWKFSDEQLLDHAVTLLFAGHDTTTTTVSFLLYELARHPLWRGRVCKELDAELGDRRPRAEQLFSGLPVLEQAIDETLRLYPPVPGGMRHSVEPFEFNGHRVPAGIHVQYFPWASHRLADVFEDPESFRPERMSREAKAELPKGAYVPFGGGRRICLGKRFGYLEAKVIVSRLLQRFAPELAGGADVRVKWAATLMPSGGVPMWMHAR